MAKEVRRRSGKAWMEVVPSLLEFPRRPSDTRKLDTIPEEDFDPEDDDSIDL